MVGERSLPGSTYRSGDVVKHKVRAAGKPQLIRREQQSLSLCEGGRSQEECREGRGDESGRVVKEVARHRRKFKGSQR